MLPSKGYFSCEPCVFFSDGGCCRPYCHYRHSYQDVVSGHVSQRTQVSIPMFTPTLSTSKPIDQSTPLLWSPYQVDLVTKLVENAVDKALQSDHTKIPRNTLVKNTLDKLFSDPEALKMASSRKMSPFSGPVPSYKPTPISKLTIKHLPVLCAPDKPYPSQIRSSNSEKSAKPHGNYSSKNNAHNWVRHEQTDIEQSSGGHNFDYSAHFLAKKSSNIPPTSENSSQRRENCNQPNSRVDTKKGPNVFEEHQYSIQLENVVKPCRIQLSRLDGMVFEKHGVCKNRDEDTLSVSCKKQADSANELGLSNKGKCTQSSGSIKKNLPSVYTETVHQILPAIQSQENPSDGGTAFDPKTIQNDAEPPAKKKKINPICVNVVSSSDPFSRWMKNKKIRQILGKDKKPEVSAKNVPGSNLLLTHKRLPCPITGNELPEPKTVKRIAHYQDHLPVPIIAEDVNIPSAFRHHFCAAFFEEFKKKMSVGDAKKKAVEEELKVAKTSKMAKTYKNNCSLLLVKFRRGVEDIRATPRDFTPASCPDFTYGWSLYRSFSRYLLSEDELRINGFPMAVPNKRNCAYVCKSARRYSIQQPEKPCHKICSLCSVGFQVDASGMPTTKDDCHHHWGKLRKTKFEGQFVKRFTCCGGDEDSAPCEFSRYHVWSGLNEDCMEDFVETKKLPSGLEDHEAGIYALDCEMCYTTNGLELARLTVLDLNGRSVFDQVISIENPILNYCTPFSGIDARKMASATHTFDDVRRWLLEHFHDKTILVGHSLENDLKALKLIHRTVVDTSVTFPHKYGPPNKMSLKHLANVVLELNIQENVDGHDSKEDAATCLKLMMKKILEDSKARKPRIIIGYHGKKK